uniref:Uncharacterized protein n=1 Tax=Canis lupus dingo TaxID=286419 RepID=A0A8C0KEA9_CANLU
FLIEMFHLLVNGAMTSSPSLPRSQIAGSYSSSIFNFLRTVDVVSTMAAPTYIPINSARGVPFSPHHHQHLALVFLMTAFVTGVGRYLIVVLISISLMMSDVERLFRCLWPSGCLLWKNVYSGYLPIF